eukprot:Phypoly_transcript_09392.p1 GENE.Phypoly_transcript_09392~~Phypoly_transcript_09392.p1  ORF type:complete len:379 (+),score=59.12 Phypoly_transcript_09392:35-1171(+)
MEPRTTPRKSCALCAAVKAKCSRTQPCERCTRKGLLCRYLMRKLPSEKGLTIEELRQVAAVIPWNLPLLTETTPASTSPPPIPTNPGFSPSPPVSPPAPCTALQPQTTRQSGNNFMMIPESHQANPATYNFPTNSAPAYTFQQMDATNSPQVYTLQISLLLQALNNAGKDSEIMQNLVPILDTLTNFLRNLQTPTEGLVVDQVKMLNKLVGEFISTCFMQRTLSQQSYISTAKFIVDPQKMILRDCNESFLRMLGLGLQKKQELASTDLRKLFKPFLWRVFKRDFSWYLANKVTQAEQYMIIPHPCGDVIYAWGYWEMMSPNYVIFSPKTICEEIPPCIQLMYRHYLGLYGVAQVPQPRKECHVPYCHCKMLNLPLPT